MEEEGEAEVVVEVPVVELVGVEPEAEVAVDEEGAEEEAGGVPALSIRRSASIGSTGADEAESEGEVVVVVLEVVPEGDAGVAAGVLGDVPVVVVVEPG